MEMVACIFGFSTIISGFMDTLIHTQKGILVMVIFVNTYMAAAMHMYDMEMYRIEMSKCRTSKVVGKII